MLSFSPFSGLLLTHFSCTTTCAIVKNREEEERRERTAACAQLIAQTQASSSHIQHKRACVHLATLRLKKAPCTVSARSCCSKFDRQANGWTPLHVSSKQSATLFEVRMTGPSLRRARQGSCAPSLSMNEATRKSWWMQLGKEGSWMLCASVCKKKAPPKATLLHWLKSASMNSNKRFEMEKLVAANYTTRSR
jgi:hypothetical protein